MNSDQVISDLATIKCTLKNQSDIAQERHDKSEKFREQSLAVQSQILDQARKTNGRVLVLEDETIKWKTIMPNSHNWKFYLVCILLLVGTRIGADFLKALISTSIKINL